MAGFVVIATRDIAAGFRLGGFDCIELERSAPDLSARVTTLLEDIEKEGRYGIVCIEEALYDELPEDVSKLLKKKGLPVVVPITVPEAWGEVEPGESPIVRLIRRAIGYHIKLRK